MKKKNLKILGIETTCDETSASVVEDGRIVLSNIIASQAKLHSKYGGIVPEVASRKHFEALPIVVDEALKEASININDLDAIAVSKEPGLPPALSVGYAYASGLALANDKELIEVNHLEAHISAIWISKNKENLKEIPYPYLCLLVSGGHTQLILVSKENNYKILGSTRDDAAGEAFDKTARLLNLGYPGGPVIDKISKSGDEHMIIFPRPMIDSTDFDFSFSGLKTAVRREVQKQKESNNKYKAHRELHNEISKNWISDIAASFQEAIIETLVVKTINAAEEIGVENIAMAGGVSANSRLREQLGRACDNMGYHLFYPDLEYCVDNAAMVAARGRELIKN